MATALNTKRLPGPYNGLEAKIRFIRDKYRESLLGHPEVRAWAEVAAGGGSRAEQVARLFQALRQAYHYCGDPDGFLYKGAQVGVELMKAPWEVVREIRERGHASGDCDDQAAANYAMLKSIGVPVRVRVVWLFGPMPRHIYLMAWTGRQWVSFDTTARTLGFERTVSAHMDFA